MVGGGDGVVVAWWAGWGGVTVGGEEGVQGALKFEVSSLLAICIADKDFQLVASRREYLEKYSYGSVERFATFIVVLLCPRRRCILKPLSCLSNPSSSEL